MSTRKVRAIEACPKGLQEEFHGRLRLIFEAAELDTARRLKHEVVQQYAVCAPKAVERLETGFEDVMAVMALPAKYRKQLRTTNGVERLNQEIRRQKRVIRIFPNEESAVRLVGAVLVEIEEAWSSGSRYFDMVDYWEWKDNTEKRQKEANSADIRVNAT